jgi:uncharacterized protein (DUF2249 family)
MSGTRVIDARGLPPPQPFELVMEALCDLAPDEEIVLVLDREPTPLYPVLARNGYAWTTSHHDGGGRVEVRIRERGRA